MDVRTGRGVWAWAINGPSIQKTHPNTLHQRCTDVSRACNKNKIRHTRTAAPSIFGDTHIHWFGDNAFSLYWFWLREAEDSATHTTRSRPPPVAIVSTSNEVVRKQTENYNIYRSITVYDMGIEFLFLFPLWLDVGTPHCTNVEHSGPDRHLSRTYTKLFSFLLSAAEPLAVI